MYKKIKTDISILLLLSVFLLSILLPKSVKADTLEDKYGRDIDVSEAFLSEGDNPSIFFETKDTYRTSTTTYGTVGATVSFVDSNDNIIGQLPSDFFEDSFANPVEVIHNGEIMNAFAISFAQLLNGADSLGLLNDLVSGAVDLVIDSVMVVRHNGVVETDANGKPIKYGVEDGMMSVEELMNTEAWRNKWGITTHFNNRIKFPKLIPDEYEEDKKKPDDDGSPSSDPDNPDPDNPDKPITHDHTIGGGGHGGGVGTPICCNENEPYYATGNYSTEYDIGKGIPSSEKVKNKTVVDEWHAYTVEQLVS